MTEDPHNLFPMRVSIASDGGPTGTKVLNSDGTLIPAVSSITVQHNAGDAPVAIIRILQPTVSFDAVRAMVPLEDLRHLADAHGFDLVLKPPPILEGEIEPCA